MSNQAAQAAQGSAATMMRYDANKKSMGVSYVLWFFLGWLGAHRFYNGKTGGGIAQLTIFTVGFLLTFIGIGVFVLGALSVWVLVDAFLIPGWVRAHNNSLATSLGA
jgi:TM2 domain-containing membrane protein YozV